MGEERKENGNVHLDQDGEMKKRQKVGPHLFKKAIIVHH